MQNKLMDLNNHMFAELERLGDETLAGDALREEIARASAIAATSGRIIENGGLILRAMALAYDAGLKIDVPNLFLEEKPYV